MTDISTEPARPVAKRASPKWETEAKESIRGSLRRFQKPLMDLLERDANEGDTRLLVTDFLCSALGYDRYEDLTTEFQVRGEFADYGIRIDRQLVAFIEVKRAAQQLHGRHLRQVETYAVKEGLEWVILTNGRVWRVYNIRAGTGQQVATTLVLEVDMLSNEPIGRKVNDLFHFHRSAMKRSTIDELWKRKAATSGPSLAGILLSDLVLEGVRKEIRRRSGYNPDTDDIASILRSEVIRPELL